MRIINIKTTSIMCKSKLTEEEIFFGTIDQEGKKDSLIPRQPSIEELKKVWESATEAFSAKCDCGARMYAYFHILEFKETGNRSVIANRVSFFCPNCGKKETLGGNYFRAQERLSILKELL